MASTELIVLSSLFFWTVFPLSLSLHSVSLHLPLSCDCTQPPPLFFSSPLCLLPSAVSEFPRVRQRETITLRRIRSPPISPCPLLPGSAPLSSSPSSTLSLPSPRTSAFILHLHQPKRGFLARTRGRMHGSSSPLPFPSASSHPLHPRIPSPPPFRQSI